LVETRDPFSRLGQNPGLRRDDQHRIDPGDQQGPERAGLRAFGPEGWINKHGRLGGPEVPESVENSTRGYAVDELRRPGLLPPKGSANITVKDADSSICLRN